MKGVDPLPAEALYGMIRNKMKRYFLKNAVKVYEIPFRSTLADGDDLHRGDIEQACYADAIQDSDLLQEGIRIVKRETFTPATSMVR